MPVGRMGEGDEPFSPICCGVSEVRTKGLASFRPTPAKAGGEPESREHKKDWITASAVMTKRGSA